MWQLPVRIHKHNLTHTTHTQHTPHTIIIILIVPFLCARTLEWMSCWEKISMCVYVCLHIIICLYNILYRKPSYLPYCLSCSPLGNDLFCEYQTQSPRSMKIQWNSLTVHVPQKSVMYSICTEKEHKRTQTVTDRWWDILIRKPNTYPCCTWGENVSLPKFWLNIPFHKHA